MYRIEEDSIGKKEVPIDAYYGVQTLRASENFKITDRRLYPDFINAMVSIKKACALTNYEVGVLAKEKADAIVKACDEILEGKFHDSFIVDPLQGGAGTSMNMNANEVIANRANEILGGKKGAYDLVHPNDHVNFGQSTNDVIPSSGKLAMLVMMEHTLKALKDLAKAFDLKGEEFKDILKMGRTQMQDAVPITLGQEFHAYASATKRAIYRIERAKGNLLSLNMGGTAIGTGINADINYFNNIVPKIKEITGYDFIQAEDMIDGTQNIDCFLAVSGAIKTSAMALSKIANDLRLLSSGPRTGFGEITLPAKQNGSSIMPGKVNPVIPEVLNQACFKIAGNDFSVTMAVESGQLELNAFEPVIYDCVFESIIILEKAVRTFTENCVKGITANVDTCEEHLNASVGIATALCPYIGYKKAAYIAKKSLKERIPVKELVLKENLMKEEDLIKILEPERMTRPGIK